MRRALANRRKWPIGHFPTIIVTRLRRTFDVRHMSPSNLIVYNVVRYPMKFVIAGFVITDWFGVILRGFLLVGVVYRVW